MCRWQPGVQRKHTCLGTETDQHDKYRRLQNSRIGHRHLGRQTSSGQKYQCVTVPVQHKDTEQTGVSTAQGEKQVFESCQNRLPGSVVHDQRC